jgi:integrase/recombinase XerD
MTAAPKLHYLNTSECHTLLSSINNPKHKLIVLLMLDCGLRVSECRTLRYANFNFKEKTLTIKSLKKRGDNLYRFIPLSDRLYHHLAEYIATQPKLDKDHYLFPSHKSSDTAICRYTVNKMLARAKQRTNIHQLHPHALRHTFATQLLINDTPIQNIKTLLGHNKLDTTLIYTHIPAEQLRRNIQSISRPRSLWAKLWHRLFPAKTKPINITFNQNNISIGRNQEIATLQTLHHKQVNTIITGDIGVGKSHLLQQLTARHPGLDPGSNTQPKFLLFDDLDNIKRTLGQTLVYLYKNDKEQVYNLIYGPFDLSKANTRITRESLPNLCREIIQVTAKKEYTIIIDSIDGITPKTVKVLEQLKHHFTIIAAARTIKINHTSLFWDFEHIKINTLPRPQALELINRLTTDIETQDYNLLQNHIYEQTNGNPRAIHELVNRYRKEPILCRQTIKAIRHTGALPEYDLTIFIAIFLGLIASLKYFTQETGNTSLRTIGGCALILLLLSRYIFPKLKRKYI